MSKTGIENITRPLLIKYPKKSGGDVRIMFQSIAAIEHVSDDSCAIYTSGGVFEIALSEEAVLKDLSGYKF